MRLAKETRELLWSSQGKPVSIEWPEDAPEPKKGHKYSVQSSAKAGEAKIIVLSVEGQHVSVRLDNDPVRLLARQQGLRQPQQYTSSSAGAIEDDAGEAVDAETQHRLTREGRLRFVQTRQEISQEEQQKRQARAARSELTETLSKMGEPQRTEFLAQLKRMCAEGRS